jgi:hypothetical protein
MRFKDFFPTHSSRCPLSFPGLHGAPFPCQIFRHYQRWWLSSLEGCSQTASNGWQGASAMEGAPKKDLNLWGWYGMGWSEKVAIEWRKR